MRWAKGPCVKLMPDGLVEWLVWGMTGGEGDRGLRRMGDLGEGGVGGRRAGLLDLDVNTVASDMPRGLYGEMEGRWKVDGEVLRCEVVAGDVLLRVDLRLDEERLV